MKTDMAQPIWADPAIETLDRIVEAEKRLADALAEMEVAKERTPEQYRRQARIALSFTPGSDDESEPIFATSEAEIHGHCDRLASLSARWNGQADPHIERIREASILALRSDEERLSAAHASSGFAAAWAASRVADAELEAARKELSAAVPATPEGRLWLNRFILRKANALGNEEIARAAAALSVALERDAGVTNLSPN